MADQNDLTKPDQSSRYDTEVFQTLLGHIIRLWRLDGSGMAGLVSGMVRGAFASVSGGLSLRLYRRNAGNTGEDEVVSLPQVSVGGNAATATKLATARSIGGVNFDGSADINLPGVNAAGTQDTSGNAATASYAGVSGSLRGGTTSGTSTAYTLAPTPELTSYTAGQSFWVTFHTASGASPTLQISGVATPPNLVKQLSDGTYANVGAGDIPSNHRSRVTLLSSTQALVEDMPPLANSVGSGLSVSGGVLSATVQRSHIAGLTLSTAGSSSTMSIAAGQATDSTNSVSMSLGSSLGKTTSAWAVGSGSGGLDTGTIANSTWYYFFLIRRPDTGVVDVVFSTSSSAPTLPTNYTQYRYIGAGLTNGSGQWTKFKQFGDEFTWDTPVLDFNGAGSATAVLTTLSVPRGRKMKAAVNISGSNTTGTYLSDPSNADLAPSGSAAPLASSWVSTPAVGSVLVWGAQCWTNTSAQVRRRDNNTTTYQIATIGWTDLRGKDL